MHKKTIVVIGAACLALSGCIIIDGHDEDDGPGRSYHIETQFGISKLKAVNVEADRVTIRIDSNGCTTKQSIDASVDQDGRNEYEIAFDRIEEDDCEAHLPDGVALTWTYDELDIPKGAYVRVLNKVKG